MNLRTKSRNRQRRVWALAALTAFVLYSLLSIWLFGSVSLNVLTPCQHRLFLLVFIPFVLFAWETRWDGSKIESGVPKKREDEEKKAFSVRTPSLPPFPAPPLPVRTPTVRPASVPALEPIATSAEPPADDGVSGEELYVRARALPHQPVPDFESDAEYLDLLGRAAAKGYPRALMKLGEYAMRREAWVEAYYWMRMAQQAGMKNLAGVLLEIRRRWAMDDFPEQSSNVSPLFSQGAGSIARALLGVDSGHDASSARAFLRAEAPDCLKRPLKA